MKKLFFAVLILALSSAGFTQNTNLVLYGVIKRENLKQAPYDQWFNSNYDNYHPAPAIVQSIRSINMKGIAIEIFFGTWCGDSRREVPRFLRILDELSFDPGKIKIIALGSQDSLFKQSPQHEESGKGIFRVPVFIMYKNGVEINRINEFPVFSLEKDLQIILANRPYSPNYRSFATLRTWLADGTLSDKNNSPAGLAQQLKPFFPGEREINALGYLLLGQNRKEEALKIFQINANLYPESANVLSSLGEGYFKTGDTQNAIRYLERALEINKDPSLVKGILQVLYLVK